MNDKKCNDKKCPYHGSVKVRGATFTGRVISAKPTRTVTVERTLLQYVPKFERYKKTRSRIHAHNPECINAKENDIVLVGETRKLSKTKSFVVLKVLSGENEGNKR
jgi:small subunit ribosomal protein S17